jgi:hypothetical protein
LTKPQKDGEGPWLRADLNIDTLEVKARDFDGDRPTLVCPACLPPASRWFAPPGRTATGKICRLTGLEMTFQDSCRRLTVVTTAIDPDSVIPALAPNGNGDRNRRLQIVKRPIGSDVIVFERPGGTSRKYR